MLSPAQTHALLDELGHHPRKRLGQNFLIDANIVRKSLDLARVRPGNRIVEIGPGLGTLTRALILAGAEVWAIEADRTLHDYLARALLPRHSDTFHLVHGDALDEPLAGLAPGGANYKIVANLPYAISSPWLDAVLGSPSLPNLMVLMLQKEAADRYQAPHGSKSFGAISIFLQAAFEKAAAHPVSAACFYPRPDVDSVLLSLTRREEPVIFPEPFKAIVRQLFIQRRKQVGGVLRKIDPSGTVMAALEASGTTPETRAEDIPLATWIATGRVFEADTR